jgi:hypothetical protein
MSTCINQVDRGETQQEILPSVSVEDMSIEFYLPEDMDLDDLGLGIIAEEKVCRGGEDVFGADQWQVLYTMLKKGKVELLWGCYFECFATHTPSREFWYDIRTEDMCLNEKYLVLHIHYAMKLDAVSGKPEADFDRVLSANIRYAVPQGSKHAKTAGKGADGKAKKVPPRMMISTAFAAHRNAKKKWKNGPVAASRQARQVTQEKARQFLQNNPDEMEEECPLFWTLQQQQTNLTGGNPCCVDSDHSTATRCLGDSWRQGFRIQLDETYAASENEKDLQKHLQTKVVAAITEVLTASARQKVEKAELALKEARVNVTHLEGGTLKPLIRAKKGVGVREGHLEKAREAALALETINARMDDDSFVVLGKREDSCGVTTMDVWIDWAGVDDSVRLGFMERIVNMHNNDATVGHANRYLDGTFMFLPGAYQDINARVKRPNFEFSVRVKINASEPEYAQRTGWLFEPTLPLADSHRYRVELLSKKGLVDEKVQVAVPEVLQRGWDKLQNDSLLAVYRGGAEAHPITEAQNEVLKLHKEKEDSWLEGKDEELVKEFRRQLLSKKEQDRFKGKIVEGILGRDIAVVKAEVHKQTSWFCGPVHGWAYREHNSYPVPAAGADKPLAPAAELQELLKWTEEARLRNLTRVEKLAEKHVSAMEKEIERAERQGDKSVRDPAMHRPARLGTRVKAGVIGNANRGCASADHEPKQTEKEPNEVAATKHPSEWTPHDLARWLVSKDSAFEKYSKQIVADDVELGDLDDVGLKDGLGVESAAERGRIIGFIAELNT